MSPVNCPGRLQLPSATAGDTEIALRNLILGLSIVPIADPRWFTNRCK